MTPLHNAPDDELERQLRESRRLESAPEHVIQRALLAWRPRARPVSALRRLSAVLGFDSAALLRPALGLRSSGAAVRQLLFSVDGRDVDLRIAADEGGQLRLNGQVLGPDLAGQVQLQVGAHRQTVALDELAEFRFDAVPAGVARIELQLGGTVIELPSFPLTPN